MADMEEVIAVRTAPAPTVFRLVVVVASALAIAAGTLAVTARAADPTAQAPSPTQIGPTPSSEVGRPDIVLILTDDQRFDTLWAMPTVRSELVANGIRFTNGYVSNPVCCPSRSSILTGRYSHSTGVYTNHQNQRYGGFPAFRDGSNVATWLQGSGYRTALLGKYLNGYGSRYIPPGWDRWFATWDDGAYFDYSANDDGVLRSFGSGPEDYGTDVLGNEAATFIRSTDDGQPLFLYFAPHAAHGPATPAPRDARAFARLEQWRPASYDETDVSDKPAHIRRRARISPSAAETIATFRRDQYRALRSVDRAVGQILEALADTGRLANTLIVFTSDNGMLWGEHRWNSKVVPYEESIHVPFVIRFDAAIDGPRRDDRLVLNIDLAPTFAELADVRAPKVEGRSLVPLFSSLRGSWRTHFLLEHYEETDEYVPSYCGVHSRRWVYVNYRTGEEELYDLVDDPANCGT